MELSIREQQESWVLNRRQSVKNGHGNRSFARAAERGCVNKAELTAARNCDAACAA
jgi:hypothetical protein